MTFSLYMHICSAFSNLSSLTSATELQTIIQVVRGMSSRVHSQKRASCKTFVNILQQLVTTSRYQDAFAWLATGWWRQVCCKLSTGLLRVDCPNWLSTGLLQVVSTSCDKSSSDKLQQAWLSQACCNLMKLTSLLQLADKSQQPCGGFWLCNKHHQLCRQFRNKTLKKE